MQTVTSGDLVEETSKTSRLVLLLDTPCFDENECYQLLESTTNYPLFKGTPFASMLHVSPHLIELGEEHQALLEACLEKRSGCIVVSDEPLKDMQQALAKQLVVKSAVHGVSYLRFYTPMVTRAMIDDSINPDPTWPIGEGVYLPDLKGKKWQPIDLSNVRSSITEQTTTLVEEQIQIFRMAYSLGETPECQALTDGELHRLATAIVYFQQLPDFSFKALVTWQAYLMDHYHGFADICWHSFFRTTKNIPEAMEAAKQVVINKNTPALGE
ncbi:DUF4123 domain-containing protein [Grimontia marina]|uniref:DUF4123 domain-containing protein n=1 Tax=Grimontia marina TaxID=646534 RepID=A0A128EUS8_9GAMM|nr:DUF4123 domain-containing protein [Grimontia marina]CZF77875.1 hypothetical protein GMA8713_00345 [Grimontia marina]